MTKLTNVFNGTMLVLTIILNVFKMFLANHVINISYSAVAYNHFMTEFFTYWAFLLGVLLVCYVIVGIIKLLQFDTSKEAKK